MRRSTAVNLPSTTTARTGVTVARLPAGIPPPSRQRFATSPLGRGGGQRQRLQHLQAGILQRPNRAMVNVVL
jgi:hypothetical protein